MDYHQDIAANGMASGVYAPSYSVSALSNGTSIFTASLHKALRNAHPDSNLVFSPFSLSVVLAMVFLGARDNTSEEISETCKFQFNETTLLDGYQEVMASFVSYRQAYCQAPKSENSSHELLTWNKVYYQTGYALQDQYVETLEMTFGYGVEDVDFADNETATNKINGWISRASKGKNSDFLRPDSINLDTVLTLVNGMYFKAPWKIPFDQSSTSSELFNLVNCRKMYVDMMHTKESYFRYAIFEYLQAAAIELPYKGDRFSLIVFLPDEDHCLTVLESYLKTTNVAELFGYLKFGRPVLLQMPKFSTETMIDFTPALKKLGIRNLFDRQSANLSGMLSPSETKQLYASNIRQKTIMEFSETGSGTEADSANYGRLHQSSASKHEQGPMNFRLNRPFLYYIVDMETKIILFTGVCLQPPRSKAKSCTNSFRVTEGIVLLCCIVALFYSCSV